VKQTVVYSDRFGPICLNFDFHNFEMLRKNFELISNFKVQKIDFETLTLVFEVKKTDFETSTSNDFNTRNAEA
jgi:hypothetical protein